MGMRACVMQRDQKLYCDWSAKHTIFQIQFYTNF